MKSPGRLPLFALFLVAFGLLTSPGRCADKAAAVGAVKLLTIGNSFADNSTAFLPDLAKAAGKQLTLFRADLGGHSMQQHVGYLQAYEANHADPKGCPYKKTDPVTGKVRNISLCEALESEAWNYVTIQQLSTLSFKPETYEPYARILIDYIHKHAPKAKILVHETWAYRENHPFLASERITQQKMFQGLREAYHQLASRYSLEIIPVGDAVQAARTKPWWGLRSGTAFHGSGPKPGAAPGKPGQLTLALKPEIDSKQGKDVLSPDGRHCNVSGEYLGASVFYEKLFDHVEGNRFVPPNMTPDDTAALQKIACDTVCENNPHPQAVAEKAK